MRTRTQTKTLVIPVGSYHYVRHDNAPVPSSCSNPIVENITTNTIAYTETAQVGGESITDELHYGKGEGYCLHTNHEYRCFYNDPPNAIETHAGSPSCCHQASFSGGYLAYTYLRTRLTLLNPTFGSQTFDWKGMSYYALKTMRPKFSDLSLFNDVLELHQIRDLVKPFGKDLLKKLNPANKHPTLSPSGQLLSAGANAELWYSFGVQPLIEDIKGVAELIGKIPKTIADIRRRATRLQTRHYARMKELQGISLPADTTSVVENPLPDFRQVSLQTQCRWVDPPAYHATLKFRYDVAMLDDLALACSAWAQAFGLDKPLTVAWNAIPFSFVVDWFVDVGEWIDSLQADPVLPIVIEDFSHSVKWSYRADVTIRFWNGLYTAPLGVGEHSYYERRRDIPSTIAPLHFGMPSVEQLSLGAALLVQGAESALSRRRTPTRMPPKPKWLNFNKVPGNQIR
ncbi:maturation protein [ssRNA phage Zoerhiza.1_33]|uniref:Maturation protein n=2 Tax=Leviviricetes TaxID=2842243 RepID=A0A8S5L173_9VIRU|nr:maturation protein [ssRNA phage Zoerhiza.1_33]QDH86995.1 MAG: hypothetical protein H1Rhizo27539_000003 [Leviviridae sp.]DAD51393.1 TPA_asm: maturation protein [ssRNA phage Zoerhiza.1_33]